MTIEVGGASGGLPQLAPDLTWPSDKIGSTQNFTELTAITVTAGVKSTVVSLSGKRNLSYLKAINLIAEAMIWKLTIDGDVKFNSEGKSGTSELLIGTTANSIAIHEEYDIKSSMLLEVTTTTDIDIGLDILARPLK